MKVWTILPVLPLATGALFLSSCKEEVSSTPPLPTEDSIEKSEVSEETELESRVFVFTGGSRIRFSGGEAEDAPRGGFLNFVGRLDLIGNELNPDGEHLLTIDMNSVFSRDEELVRDLKGDDFFAVSFFPVSTLNITHVAPGEEGMMILSGNYQAHGSNVEVSVPAQVRYDEQRDRLMMSLTLPVKWRDFGIVPFGASKELAWEEGEIRMELVAIEGEPQEIELTPEGEMVTTFGAPSREWGGKGGKGGKGGTGGLSREDWRNLSDAQRAKLREEFLARIDINGDGYIAKNEVGERAWEFMRRGDKNGDEMLSETERNEMRAEREAERTLRELNGESPFGGGPRGGRGPRGGAPQE